MKMRGYEYDNSEITKSTRLRVTCGLFEDVRGLAVDDAGGFVYWVHLYNIIKQVSLNDYNKKTILDTGKFRVI